MESSEFAEKLVDLIEARRGVFANKINVEDWVPAELDSAGKANYLFYLTQLDYAVKSILLYQGAQNLFYINKSFFTPGYISKTRKKQLESAMKQYLRPRYINEAVLRYKLNSQELNKHYDGNSLEIFKDGDAKQILKKIWEFRGFGPKTGNLFFRSVVTTFGLELENVDDILQPVDIHDVRIAKLMGYIENDQMTDKNIDIVKKMWSAACKKADVNWLMFDKALWILGSVGKPKSREDVIDLITV